MKQEKYIEKIMTFAESCISSGTGHVIRVPWVSGHVCEHILYSFSLLNKFQRFKTEEQEEN
jgi:hypothetical protein